jgi:hypothetical protein
MPTDQDRSSSNPSLFPLFGGELTGCASHDIQDGRFERCGEVVLRGEGESALGEDVGGDVSSEGAVLWAGDHVVVNSGGDEDGLGCVGGYGDRIWVSMSALRGWRVREDGFWGLTLT